MKFEKIIGKIDPKLIANAEEILTKVFTELGVNITNDSYASNLGGDPLVFALIVPAEHVATLNIPTAATDGIRFYWNPNWICSKSLLGNRLTTFHESGHAFYMHPQRRGSRIPKLWNIAIDYIVNGMMFEDLKIRLKNNENSAKDAFVRGLGNYMTLDQCIAYFKDPFALPPGFENWQPDPADAKKVDLPAPQEDRELTEEEKKELEKRSSSFKCYFADPNLPEDMKRPERIYDLLFSHLPKCPECGAVGKYPFPSKNQKGQDNNEKGNRSSNQKQNDKNQGDQHDAQGHDGNHDHHDHDHGNNDGNGNIPENEPSKNGCSTCGNGFDILDFGDTVDDHIDAVEEPEKLAKKLSDAIKTAKQMAGRVPHGLEDELGILTAPRLRWQDFIKAKISKTRQGNSKNDWTSFRTRPLFAGLMIPKRTNCVAKFACLLDTSGSMGRDDMAFGVSQLSILDERSEGIIIPADAQIYWDKATKLRSMKTEALSQVKIVGRGGTQFAEFFRDYSGKVGKMDFLIVITDGFLLQDDVASMENPGVDVLWLITSGSAFKAPFGRSFDLRNT